MLEGTLIFIKYPTITVKVDPKAQLTQELTISPAYEQAWDIETGLHSKSLDYPTLSSYQPGSKIKKEEAIIGNSV